jgi:hypothetical protein
MAQFVIYLLALWHWVAVNGLSLVIAINFVVFVCAIALAIHACALSRRIKELRLASDRNAMLLGKVMQEIDARMAAVEPLPIGAPAKDRPPAHVGAFSSTPAIREELESLQEEMASALSDIACDLPQDFATQPIESDALARRVRDEIESLKTELAAEDDAA